jgi:DinB superfamily
MTLEQLRIEFAHSEGRVDKLLEKHDCERLNVPPGPGRWSALQCIEHVSLANELNTGALAIALRDGPRLPAAGEHIRTGLLWRILLKGVEPNFRLRGFAPRVLRPADRLDPGVTCRRFQNTHVTLRELMACCEGIAFNRIRFPHPAIRLRISAGATFWLLALHESRHLQQAERAVEGR